MSDLKQTRAHYEGLADKAKTYQRADMWQGWDDDRPEPFRILGHSIADIITLFIISGIFWAAVFEVAL